MKLTSSPSEAELAAKIDDLARSTFITDAMREAVRISHGGAALALEYLPMNEARMTLAMAMIVHSRARDIPTEQHMQHVERWQGLFSRCIRYLHDDLVTRTEAQWVGKQYDQAVQQYTSSIYNLVSALSRDQRYQDAFNHSARQLAQQKRSYP